MRVYLLSILLILLSCTQNNQKSKSDISQENQNDFLTKEDIAALKYTDYALDSKAFKEQSAWQKYGELEVLVNDVKNANLSFFKDNKDVLKSFLEDLKSTTPEKINTPAIQARLKVIETMSYKLEDQLMLSQPKKDDMLNSIKGFLEAFSNLNFQINKKLERDSQNIQKP